MEQEKEREFIEKVLNDLLRETREMEAQLQSITRWT